MKALSIKQPWAWLICYGCKDIENRNWRIGRKPIPGSRWANFTLELPARIYVHAAKQFDHAGLAWLTDNNETRPMLEVEYGNGRDPYYGLMEQEISDYPVGAIIGEVDIVACVTESKSLWFTGRYGFVLANPVRYEKPIRARGSLGFFEVTL